MVKGPTKVQLTQEYDDTRQKGRSLKQNHLGLKRILYFKKLSEILIGAYLHTWKRAYVKHHTETKSIQPNNQSSLWLKGSARSLSLSLSERKKKNHLRKHPWIIEHRARKLAKWQILKILRQYFPYSQELRIYDRVRNTLIPQ